jgi:nitroreductase
MLIDLLRNRRSIRRYENRPVEKEKVDQLVEAVLRAPSSRGFNPWQFVVVTDPEMLEKLSRAKPHGASFLKNAPLAVVVCADPSVSDVWVEDASIASITCHLAAADLGLGSCWIQIRKRSQESGKAAGLYIAGLLGLPENLEVESIVAIGYPAEVKKGHPADELQYEKVSYERFGAGGK